MATLFPENGIRIGSNVKCYLQLSFLKNSKSNPPQLSRVSQSRVCHPGIYACFFTQWTQQKDYQKQLCKVFEIQIVVKNLSRFAGAESTTVVHICDRALCSNRQQQWRIQGIFDIHRSFAMVCFVLTDRFTLCMCLVYAMQYLQGWSLLYLLFCLYNFIKISKTFFLCNSKPEFLCI